MYQLACKDLGMKCDFVLKGATVEELVPKAFAHAQEKHMAEFMAIAMDPAKRAGMEKQVRAAIKQVAG